MRLAVLLVVVGVGLACSALLSSDSPKRVAPGNWGGQHAALSVEAGGGAIEFDCGHGTLDAPLLLDADGRFDVEGTYTREHGGPIRKDEQADTRPARYFGSSRERTLTLSVTPRDTETLGPFDLELGRSPRLFKCL